MRIWIRRPLAIFAEDSAGGVVIDNGKIVECVSGTEPAEQFDKIFDASEHVVLPGLINVHHHFYQTLTRAFDPALNKELFCWLKALYPVWSRLTPEQLDVATRLSLAELLLSGCTTTSDHHYMFPIGLEKSIDIQVQAVQDMGLRATLTRGSMNLSEETGGLPPKSAVQDTDTILADCERVIDKYHDASDGSYLQIALAPCSPFSVTKEIMEKSAQLASNSGVAMHTHLGETQDENQYCERLYKCRPLDYLEDVGWSSDNVWLAHGIHFNADEIHRLGQARMSVSHCPGSNMLLASGICRAVELEEAGVNVGIGVDGSASEDASNLIQEVRQALLIQRLRYGSARVSHMDVIRWATQGSAACLQRTDIGSIEVGKQADFAMFKLDEPRFSGAGNPLAAVILCGAHRADRVMIGGKWRVVDGEILDFDLSALMAEHQLAAKSLITG